MRIFNNPLFENIVISDSAQSKICQYAHVEVEFDFTLIFYQRTTENWKVNLLDAEVQNQLGYLFSCIFLMCWVLLSSNINLRITLNFIEFIEQQMGYFVNCILLK